MGWYNNKNANWAIPDNANWEQAQTAILMDIRGELQTLNGLFRCTNFLNIPRKLDQIVKNTHRPKRRKKKAAIT